MATHTIHPDTHEGGLVDGCPRCEEHADNPFDSLDLSNLARLQGRVDLNHAPRSGCEERAMYAIRMHNQHEERLRAARRVTT